MSSTTIARGNSITTFYIGPSITPVAVAANTTAIQTFNLPGLQVNDLILPYGYVANQIAGVWIVEADCLTAGVLTLQFGNNTAAPVTPTPGIYEFQIVRSENYPLPTTAV